MTYSGPFAYFYGAYPAYTHVSRAVGSQSQTTGDRIPVVESEASIQGSLDPMTEEDLRANGIPQHTEGQFNFFTEQSNGVKAQDLIIDPANARVVRVLRRSNSVPLVNFVIGNGADVVGFHCELTRRD